MNPFFTNTIDLLPATKARAGDVESNFTAVEAGFDEAKQYFDRTLRGARANPVIPEIPDAASRAGKALTFDGSGNPATTVTTTEISNAQANAVAAAASAVAADASATAAAGSASSAAASLDSFDDRYLGSKVSDPSVDNDGNALLVGALYWNSAVGDMRVWNGSEWVTFSNFVAKSGDTMTGPLGQAAGTALLPSYTFSGDVNTGMWSPGADILAISTAGSERFRIDSSGNVLVTGSGGLGYGTGSGGTVTQATSKSTTVTLNKPCGQITMNNAALAAGAVVDFSLSNSLITATDTVVYSVFGFINYRVETRNIQAGIVSIRVTNTSVGSLSEAVQINFAVIKGATS